jgi:hypothetical protein
MYLRTLKTLQELQHASVEPPSGPATEAAPSAPSTQAPASPRKTQPLAPPIDFVPSFTPAHGQRPPVSHENHKSQPGRTPAGQRANRRRS